MSNFQLRLNTFEQSFAVDLTDEEAAELEAAYSVVVSAVSLEELFDVVVEDYIELEVSILDSAANHMVRGFGSVSKFDWTRRLFNRRLMHLLTTARSYLDTAPGFGEKFLICKSNFKAEFKRLAAQQYDGKLGYRVLEALRNSAQHGGFPLHGFTIGGKRAALKLGRASLEYYAIPTFTVDELRKDALFKKAILQELEVRGSKFDVRPFFREYVEGLSNIQVGLREFCAKEIDHAEANVKAWIEIWRKKNPNRNAIGLALVKVGERETFEARAPISERPLTALVQFRTENGSLANLASRYVSSKAEIADDASEA